MEDASGLPGGAADDLAHQLAEVSDAFAQDLSNPALRLAKAAVLERTGLLSAALEEYLALSPLWKDSTWLLPKLFELKQAVQAAQRSVPSGP